MSIPSSTSSSTRSRSRAGWTRVLSVALMAGGLAFALQGAAHAEDGGSDDWSAPSTAPRKAPPKELLPAPIVRDPTTGRTRSGVRLPALPQARPAGTPRGGYDVGFAPIEGEGTKGPFSKGGRFSPERIRTTAPVPAGVPGHDPGLPSARMSENQGGFPAPRAGNAPSVQRTPGGSGFPAPGSAAPSNGGFPAPGGAATPNQLPPPAGSTPQIELPVGRDLEAPTFPDAPTFPNAPAPSLPAPQGNAMTPGVAAPAPGARAMIERINKVHNLTLQGGRRAVRLDAVFSVRGMQGQSVYLLVDFYDRRNGRRIRSMLPDFGGQGGEILVQTEPARIDTNDGRFQGNVWAPYGAFPAPAQGSSYVVEARMRVMLGNRALTESRTAFTVYGANAPQVARLPR